MIDSRTCLTSPTGLTTDNDDNYLKGKGKKEGGAGVGSYGNEGDFVFLEVGMGEDEGGGGADGGSGYYVPPVVLFAVDTAPGGVGGKCVGGDAVFPAVSFADEGGGGECDRRMA